MYLKIKWIYWRILFSKMWYQTQVIMCYYLHHHKSPDWKRRKRKGDVHRFVRARQVTKNVSHTGGFIGMLASLADYALPTILTVLTAGLLFAGISKAISGTVGDGLFLHKHGKCYQVQECKGDGLYLTPHPHW